METKHSRNSAFQAIIITAVMVFNLICFVSLFSLNEQVSSLQNEVADLQSSTAITITAQDSSITTASNINGVSLSNLYDSVKNSVVTIECTIIENRMPFGRQITSEVQGSGFVYEFEDQMIIMTNNHVVEEAASITVIFADGNTYDAEVIGTDFSTDLAILSVAAQVTEYFPLEIVSSQTVNVGDYVIAIGSPYGLAGTMTTGIVSALDRTLTVIDGTRGSYEITGLFQTSAPINSGNSGGPLISYDGQVIGITTAIVSNSDGLGFVVSSDTILSTVENLLA